MTMPSSDAAPIPAGTATAEPKTKNITSEKSYWNNFYAQFNIPHPSQFCVMAAVEIPSTNPIVEFGCGNGRDSIYLGTHGFKIYGCDLSADVIAKNVQKSEDLDSVDFRVVDAANEVQVKEVVDKARADASDAENVTIYTRFFLHSIDQTQEDKFLAALSKTLIAGDKLYFEFRSKEDETLEKLHGKEHYRRYIDTPVMVESLGKLGFNVEYDITGRGMAKYKAEDPFVCRIVARKV